MTATSPVVLEPAAQQVAEAFSKPPFLYEMASADARKVLSDAQSAPVSKLPVDEEWITVPAPVGDVRVSIIKPSGATGMLPVIVSMHGGGWILGNTATHERLVREFAVGTRAALAFVEYPNSPEAHYPTAIEQGYATAQWITRDGASKGLDASRMAVADESVGVITDPHAPYYGAELHERTLVPAGSARLAETRLDDWQQSTIGNR